MSEYATVSDLAIAIERAWRPYQEYITSLTPEQLDGPTDEKGWTVKDHISHVTAWEAGITAVLQGRPRYEGMGIAEEDLDLGDNDEINATIRDAFIDESAEDIVDEAQLKHEGFMMELEALPEEAVRRPLSKYITVKNPEHEKMPVGDWFWEDTGDHFKTHLTYIKHILGEEE
jgi:hypothetical protein